MKEWLTFEQRIRKIEDQVHSMPDFILDVTSQVNGSECVKDLDGAEQCINDAIEDIKETSSNIIKDLVLLRASIEEIHNSKFSMGPPLKKPLVFSLPPREDMSLVNNRSGSRLAQGHFGTISPREVKDKLEEEMKYEKVD